MATEMVTQEQLGKRLKQLRGKRGMTEVAAQMGVSVDTLRRWENGLGKRGPGYLELLQAAEYFGVTVQSFAEPDVST